MESKTSSQTQITRVGMGLSSEGHAKTGRFEHADKDALTLHSFYGVGDQWQHKQFSPRTKSVAIGPSSFDNEIGLDDHDMDKRQALLQRIGTIWYAVECGKDDLMRVNGLPGRQSVLKGKSSCVLQVGSSFVVLSTMNKLEERAKTQKRKPVEGEVHFSLPGGESYPFKHEGLFLIGGNEICDFHTGSKEFLENPRVESDAKLFEQDFLGMLFNFGGRLFMQSFTESVTVNSESAMTPVLLERENFVSFGGTVFSLGLPDSMLGAPTVLPKLDAAIFCLLPHDDPSQSFPELHIPSNARSLTIGRSSTQSDIAINEKNISRQHAQFIVYPKSMMVYDCGSSNGTFVNDEKITKKTIKPGDMITFGDVPYFFCYAE